MRHPLLVVAKFLVIYLCADRNFRLNTKIGVGIGNGSLANFLFSFSSTLLTFRIATESLVQLRTVTNSLFVRLSLFCVRGSGKRRRRRRSRWRNNAPIERCHLIWKRAQPKDLCLPRRWLLGHYDDLRLFVQQKRSECETPPQLRLFLVSYGRMGAEENKRKRISNSWWLIAILQEMGGHFGWDGMEWDQDSDKQ